VIIFSAFSVHGQDGQGGTEDNMTILGYGARALGLGKAFTAVANDPTAIYWNPAGLEDIYQQNATFYHVSLWEGTSLDFLGYAYPTIEWGSFGFAIGRIGVGDIPQTNSGGDLLGTFSNAEYQVYLGYARKFPYNITGGATIRMVRRSWSGLQNESDLTATGFGLDLGVMYKPVWIGSPWYQDWAFGLKINNFIEPQLKEGVTSDDLPLTIKLGFLKKIRFAGGENFSVMMDFDFSEKRAMRIHIGSEYRVMDYGDIRIGYTDGGLSFGAGVEYKKFQFDYSYGFSEYSDVLPGVHRISLSFSFGKNRDELYQQAEAEKAAERQLVFEELQREEDRRFIQDHNLIADRYFATGNYLEASAEYQQVLSRDSLNVHASSMADSANVLLEERFNQIQAAAVKDALDRSRAESDSAFVALHYEKGRQLLAQNQFAEAKLEFNNALERNPGNQELKDAIATVRRRKIAESQRLIEQSRVELTNQNFTNALILLADAETLAENNSSLNQQISSVKQQITIQQKINQGISMFQIGEFAKSLEIFDEVLVLDPENEIAQDYQRRSKIETLSKESIMSEETHKQYLIGMDFYTNGNLDEAIRIWEEILKQEPYNKQVLKAVQGANDKKAKSEN
jgi:tetratricopeptide (TPR) repeat protein